MKGPSPMLYSVLAALVVVACGGDAEPTDTGPSDGVTEESSTTTTATTMAEATDTTPASDPGERLEGVVSIDGTEYRFSLGEVTLGGIDSSFPTRCEPDFMGSGILTVVATAADDDGVRIEPNVNLAMTLPLDSSSPDGAEFEVSDDASSLAYVLANDEGLLGAGSPGFDGELGSWTVDGDRITGEVTVFESDHVREFFTATFDITCPAD